MVDNQIELVVTKASPERLLRQLLVDEEDDLLLAASSQGNDNIDGNGLTNTSNSAQMDSHFVEDFLLMHRVFFKDSSLAVRQLIDWFRLEPKHRERVVRKFFC